MDKREALDTLASWHHSLVDEEQAVEVATALLGDEASGKRAMAASRHTVRQLKETVVLQPQEFGADMGNELVNGFICNNDDCPLPKAVWRKDYVFNVVPFSAVKYCPVCGGTQLVGVHAYDKGEKVTVVNGHQLAARIVRELSLVGNVTPFIGTGYQHREYMHVLRNYFHQCRLPGDHCDWEGCSGTLKLVEEDHDENHPVFYCDSCGRTIGDEGGE